MTHGLLKHLDVLFVVEALVELFFVTDTTCFALFRFLLM